MRGTTKTDSYPLYDSRQFPVQVDALFFHIPAENVFALPIADDDTPIDRATDKFV